MDCTSTRALALALLVCACTNPSTGDDELAASESGSSAESSDTGDTGIVEPEPEVAWPTLTCDSLVPEYCGYPFPNNVFSAADPSTPTGRRVALTSEGLPVSADGFSVDPSAFNRADGFSAGQLMLTTLPGATTTNLPTWLDMQASLAADSPTVILDAETGERVAHFAELDTSVEIPGESFMIRPVTRLEDGKRYIVAIRGVVDQAGLPIPASPGFAALRDLSPSEDPDIEARRPLYADIFARLADAGVARADLQIAWDFTTASLASNTDPLLAMRTDALAWLADPGPTYTITSVDDQFHPEDTAYRVEGTIEVPLYLDQTGLGSRLVRDANGLPIRQGSASFPFILLIPKSALVEPAKLLQYGHGLFGGRTEPVADHARRFANTYNYAIFAVDWIGMAEADQLYVANLLTTGQIEQFVAVTDRVHQAMINFIVAARTMTDAMPNDPQFGPLLDPTSLQFLGISQGGILGGAYMTITPDIERGVLGVPGQPFNLILDRSRNFDQFLQFLLLANDDARDIQMILALCQMAWDGVESSGYTHHLAKDPLPDTPVHEVLIRSGIGDHQVTPLAAQLMARSVGATHLDTGLREVWGLDVAVGENVGSTYVEYGFGLPADPIGNVPQTACENPHLLVRELPEAQAQADHFFRTGIVQDFCTGPCEFPDLGGC